jgi:hypothetical protein
MYAVGMARKKRRRSGPLSGAAVGAKKAPGHCKRELSGCMKGGGRGKARGCMVSFNRCRVG